MTISFLKFTVDSALLEELGERIVGKPSVALAELIKNSYDADSTETEVALDPRGEGKLTVSDNGQGMTPGEFERFWMRVGSTHKRDLAASRKLKRPLTGSKGVGRIATGVLGRKIRILSTSEIDPFTRLDASLDWQKASRVGDLTEAEVKVEVEQLSGAAPWGTRVEVTSLKAVWDAAAIRSLAREVWQLQPPFRGPDIGETRKGHEFQVKFTSPVAGLTKSFNEQMDAILNLWHARATGILEKEQLTISLEFKGERSETRKFAIEGSSLKHADFEIRYYYLQRKQPKGIRVSDAREYLSRYGGVHIYDTGFRLPFYGDPKNDWLSLSLDHSRRLSASRLLPKDLQTRGGMEHLPNVQHLLGVVNVRTSTETDLKISITRDRLGETGSFLALRDAVRMAIDWYAMEKARKQLAEIARSARSRVPSRAIGSVGDALRQYQSEIPPPVMRRLEKAVDLALDLSRSEEARTAKRIAILGSLAATGISTIAFQHELRKQLATLDRVVADLRELASSAPQLRERIQSSVRSLEDSVARMKVTGKIFGHLMESENVQIEDSFRVSTVVDAVIAQLDPVLRGVSVKPKIEASLRFPGATYAEWISILQNVMLNASNAMVDSDDRRILIEGVKQGKRGVLRISDSGAGVNLAEADVLFEAFERRLKLSADRRALAYGGTGMGLTIVRMLAEARRCKVEFVKAAVGFSTTFELSWGE